MLQERGLNSITRAEYLKAFNFPVKDYYLEIGFDFSREPFEKISTEFITAYEQGRAHCSLMPHAREILELIHRSGRTQSILSASKNSYLQQAVIDHEIQAYFNSIQGLDNHHAAGKVSLAESFMETSVHKPDQVVLIGDTIHDAEIAKLIGVENILIPNGHQDRSRLAETDGILIDSLADLQSLFQVDFAP